MNFGNLILSVALAVFLSGCSSLSVIYDYNQKVDFSSYSIDLLDTLIIFPDTIFTANAIDCTFDVQLDPDEPEAVTFSQGDSIILKILFNDIVLEYARGYFGQGTYTSSDVIDYDFLEDWQNQHRKPYTFSQAPS